MHNKDNILSFENQFNDLKSNINDSKSNIKDLDEHLQSTNESINELQKDLSMIPGAFLISDNNAQINFESIKEINNVLNDITETKSDDCFNLTNLDIIVSIISGIIASVIDIVFVGTPEIVKIYRGGENFDGSILTEALRKIGNTDDKLSSMLKWLEEYCTVPYDISSRKNIIYPKNHRLRGLAHDPLFGVLFAIVDIIMGTTTTIDNDGRLRILINSKDFPKSQKYFAIVYYLGHLLSDVCTAKGLPIPGFVFTQFFTQESKESNESFAKMCENMYNDGYDFRHLASMSTPVFVKNIIIDIYIKFFRNYELTEVETIAKKEIFNNRKKIFKYKLILISDAVSCSGNFLKFFLPPTSGNPTAFNIVEWISLIKSIITNAKFQLRDKSVEKAISNRNTINNNWDNLLR